MDIQKEFETFIKLVQALEALIPALSIADSVKNNVSHYLHIANLMSNNGFALAAALQRPQPAPVEDAKPVEPVAATAATAAATAATAATDVTAANAE